MHITHLSLTNFRSFSRLDMDVPRRILLLVGSNAQGKTSLLEAIYYFATFTSFQAQNERQLVNFIAAREPLAVCRMVADFERNETLHRMEVRLIQDSTQNGTARLRKEILLDGVKRNTHEALGQFNAVIFLPQMTRMFEGGPDERRKYLNLLISQADPAYARALSEYHQILTQRNALLKMLFERRGDQEQLNYWDDLLVQRGAYIIQQRIETVQEMEKLAGQIHDRLSHSREILRLVYQPAYDPVQKATEQYSLPLAVSINRNGVRLEDIKKGFARRLIDLRSEEIARGVTTTGPHRDDCRFISNGIDLEYYGSRGQVRTTLLALKIAEVSWLRQKTGQFPVLLLDEILAELDAERRNDLMETLKDAEQTLMTTTEMNQFSPEFINANTTWKVHAGQVVADQNDLD